MGFLSFLLVCHVSAGNFFLDPHCKLGIKTDVAILIDTLPLISHIAGSAVFPVINRPPRCGTCQDQLQMKRQKTLFKKQEKSPVQGTERESFFLSSTVSFDLSWYFSFAF